MPDLERHTDTELVTAFRGGDRAAFENIYDRYADRIYSYCLTMLRCRDEAADASVAAFVAAATSLQQEEDPGELRPWLFRLARTEVRAEGRQRARTPSGIHPADSEGSREDRDLPAELRGLVWQTVDGLGERDRDLMALHLIEGLEDDDLSRVTGIEMSHLVALVARMRSRVEKTLGPLLVARLGREDCYQLHEILGDWDGTFDATVRARVTHHIVGCETCQARRSVLMTPAGVLPGIMVVAAPAGLRQKVMGEVIPADVPSTPAVAAQKRKGLSDTAKLGIFALVTVVVGLLGIAVSAQFDPLDQPPNRISDDGLAASNNTTTTTSTSLPPTTSSTVSVGTTSPQTTSPGSPGVLEVSTNTVDFGADQTTGRFDISNTGGSPVEFTIESSVETVVLSAGGDELGPGETMTYDVMLDREEVAEGEIEETITLSWEGGSFEIAVTGTHLDNPILHNPQASPSQVEVTGSSDCSNTETTVSVRVRDRSPLESVIVRWSPDGGSTRETAMTEVGGDIFEADIGPFTTVHTASVRMVATDEHENAGGATINVEVVDCP